LQRCHGGRVTGDETDCQAQPFTAFTQSCCS
jgi:hypothetical protein